MSARRLPLLAAALVIGVSELALWLEVLSTRDDLAALRRQLLEHRCPPPTYAQAPGSDFLTSTMPELPRLTPAPLTDPALEGPRA